MYEGYFTERSTPNRSRELGAQELANLRWMSHGLTSVMVAELRGLSPETVKDQLEHTRQKLAAKNTTHAIAIAIRLRLIA